MPPLLALLLILFALPTTVESDTADTPDALRRAIWQYVGPFTLDPAQLDWRLNWAELNDDGRFDALVYLTGPDWCGSGGCTLLLFEALDELDAAELGVYRPAAEINLVHGPVFVSANRTNEWHDLVLASADGELRTLRFDGETYPSSPSAGTLMAQRPEGVVLFAEGR
jgi:hypothetical protein